MAAEQMPPKVRSALVGGLLLGLGVASGAFLFGPAPTGAITLTVDGATAVSAFCGGEATVHSDLAQPEVLALQPVRPRCEVEAAFTAALPLRAVLEVGQSRDYVCLRRGVHMVCGAG